MEDNRKILSFANIDIIEYLNKVHITPDNFLVETQKHNLKKYKNELNEHLHLSFIENCDSLLKILDTYKFCHELIQGCSIPKPIQDVPNTNAKESKDLAKAFKPFADDMSPFLTNERLLVKAEAFKEFYCVLTNDLLFIGEKENNSKKYTLKNSFSKSIAELTKSHNELVVTATSGSKYIFTSDKETIAEFYDAFQEIIYEYSPENDNSTDKTDIDQNLIEFYIQTEQIYELKKYLAKLPHQEPTVLRALKNLKITNTEDLKTAMDIFRDPIEIFNDYCLERFSVGLESLNKIQLIEGLINDSFDYLEEFTGQLEHICNKIDVSQMHFILCVERLILKVFDFLEKRIFNKFYEIAINNQNIKLIKSRLRLRKMDFRYLTTALLDRREDFARGCIENAKKEIKERLDILFKHL